MSQQIQITGGAKVRSLEGVITGTSGVLSSVPLGAANGVATLDSGGKVPVSQLPSSVVTYLGTWNAATNTPTLTNGVGDAGDMYICNVAGTVNFGAGPITFAVGDWVLYGSGTWQKSSGQNGTVTSVAQTVPSGLTVTGSPITTAGTLAIGLAAGYTIPLSTQLVPTGGTTGQILAKNSNTAYDTTWIDNYANWTEQIRDTVKASVAINKGQAVYISGANGTNQLVSLASNVSEATSSKTLGLANQNFAINDIGQIITEGLISGLDTSTATAGDPVWLGVNGDLIFGLANKPAAPAHLVYIGVVTRVQSVNGEIYVKIQNGFELQELHNVSITSPANGNILQYDSATSLWKNVAGTTTNIAEGTNLYYTDARARGALSFVAGSGAYNSTTGVITIPTNNNQITNGANYITLTSLSATTPLSYNNTTGAFSISQASTSTNGYLSSTDWNTFNGKQSALTFGNLASNDTSVLTISGGTGAVIGSGATITINFASATNAGIVSTGTQTFAGGKTFTGFASFQSTSATNTQYGIYIGKGSTPTAFSSSNVNIYSDVTTNNLVIRDNLSIANLVFNNSTQTYTFPAATGTIALTSDLSSYVPTTRTLTINGTTYDLSANRSWSVGTVTSVAALTLGTSGTDLSSTVANGTTTPVITLNVPDASATARGVVSTGTQTFGGSKTFTFPVTAAGFTALGSASSLIFSYQPNTLLQHSITGATYSSSTPSANTLEFNVANQNSGSVKALILDGTGAGKFANYVSILNGVGTNQIYLPIGGDVYGTIQTNSDNSYSLGYANSIGTLGTPVLSWLGNGSVGIGTTQPLTTFHVIGTGKFSSSVTATALNLSNTDGYLGTINSTGANGGYFAWQTSGTVIADIGTSQQIFGTGGNDTFGINGRGARSLVFGTNNTERMRITSGGNVGIGTTSPNKLLEVYGTAALGRFASSSTSSYGGVEMYYGGNYISEVTTQASSGNMRLSVGPSAGWGGYMTFLTDQSERMRITSGGFLKQKNTGSYNNGSYNEMNNFNATSGDINLVLGLGANTNNTSSYYFVCAQYAIADRMYIYGNGNIVNTNGSYGTLSDISLKENIVDATPKLEDLLKLKVRNFNLIGEETKQIGFVAQEFEEVFPSMIDIDGKSGMKTIKTSVLVPMLVKAIQELSQQNQDLKSRLDKAGL